MLHIFSWSAPSCRDSSQPLGQRYSSGLLHLWAAADIWPRLWQSSGVEPELCGVLKKGICIYIIINVFSLYFLLWQFWGMQGWVCSKFGCQVVSCHQYMVKRKITQPTTRRRQKLLLCQYRFKQNHFSRLDTSSTKFITMSAVDSERFSLSI